MSNVYRYTKHVAPSAPLQVVIVTLPTDGEVGGAGCRTIRDQFSSWTLTVVKLEESYPKKLSCTSLYHEMHLRPFLWP